MSAMMMSDTTLGGTELKRKKKRREGTRKHKGRSGAHRNHNEKEHDALVKRHPKLTKVLFFTSRCLC